MSAFCDHAYDHEIVAFVQVVESGLKAPMSEEDFLPISGLQHLAFCPRQWALIHLEQAWHENLLTAQGRLLHERADLPGEGRRGSLQTVRGMWLRSDRLGLTGKADIVEFRPDPYPVEYKRGKAKPFDCDVVQLCAQALCLEEMLAVAVPRGAFFYGAPRRRFEVVFTAKLRDRTIALSGFMHQLYRTHTTPPPVPGDYCRSCSLINICMPLATSSPTRPSSWIEQQVRALLCHEDASCESF